MKYFTLLLFIALSLGCNNNNPPGAEAPKNNNNYYETALGKQNPNRYYTMGDTVNLTDNKGRKQGWWIYFDEQTSRKTKELFYYNDLEDGPFITYLQNGATGIEGQYSDGQKTGE